ncbi:MAG TPA: hypothetical protein VMV56_01650 [Williamwhitmania sp.]|nr:hypothetical protein [Williamwhitmania sp.]
MKKIFGGLLFSLLTLSASGQLIFVEAGKVISSFDYKDSNGNSLGKLTTSTQNNMGGGFRWSLFHSPWHITVGAAYNKYVAKGSDPVLGNYYEWEVAYLGANVGVDYEFFRPKITQNEQHGFSFYIRGSIATDFLVKGTQQLNNQVFNLIGKEEFNKPVYFLKAGVGLNYYISKKFILFGEYTGGQSFLIGNYKNQEQLRYTTHNISVGLAVNLIYAN